MNIIVISIVALIVLTLITGITINRRLWVFRENLKPGDLVFYLDRYTSKYFAATILSKVVVYDEHTKWRIEVHSEDGDYDIITSELNLFDKKY